MPRTLDGDEVYGEIGYWILSFFAWLTGVAGIFLNAVVYYTVIKMGDFVNSMPAILTAWKILRDLGNIALIFGFVAIGIATILDVQSYNAKKMLVKLILVAVTVNFSLFAARAIIDVGNVFAYQFYTEMNRVTGVTVDNNFWSPANKGVSDAIMQMVGLQKFYESNAITSYQSRVMSANWPFALLFASLLFIVATFVMVAFAFMLIARFLVLVLLMILAPVGFVGFVIPTMEGRASQWWSTLISQTLTAPIVLLMLLISVSLMSAPGILIGATNTRDVGALLDSSGASLGDWSKSASLIIGFFIAMGFLMASLILAKQMGAAGASFSIGMSRRLTGAALSPISKPSRAIGNTGLRYGAKAGMWAADKAYNGLGIGAAFRGSKILATTDANIQSALDKREKIKVAGVSLDDEKHARDHRAHEVHRDHTFSTLGTQLKSIKDAPDDAKRMLAEKEYSKTLQSLNQGDTFEYVKRLKNADKQEAAKYLSTERFIDIQKTDKVDQSVKDEVAGGRFQKLVAAIGTNDKKEVQRWSSKDMAEFAKLNAATFEDALAAGQFSDEQLEALEKSEALTNDQRRAVKDSSDFGKLRVLIEKDDGSAASQVNIRTQASGLGPKAKVKLSAKDYNRPAVVHSFTQVDLQRGMAEGKFSDPAEVIAELRRGKAAGVLSAKQIEGINNYLTSNDFDRGLFGLPKDFAGL